MGALNGHVDWILHVKHLITFYKLVKSRKGEFYLDLKIKQSCFNFFEDAQVENRTWVIMIQSSTLNHSTTALH